MKTILPYDTFKYYRSLKLHFSSPSYDFKKYKGRTKNTSELDYQASKDKFWCEKITKKYQNKTPSFLLCSLSNNPNSYIRDLAVNSQFHIDYNKWLSYKKAQFYRFNDDISKIQELNFKDLFSCDASRIPALFNYHIRQEIDKETVCILIKLTNCLEFFEENMKNNIFWKQFGLSYIKYLPFVILEKEDKFKQILLDKFGTIEYK